MFYGTARCSDKRWACVDQQIIRTVYGHRYDRWQYMHREEESEREKPRKGGRLKIDLMLCEHGREAYEAAG